MLNAEYNEGYNAFDRDPDNVTCKTCGAAGLKWYNLGIEFPDWRLFTTNGTRLVPHKCIDRHVHLNVIDDFEDES